MEFTEVNIIVLFFAVFLFTMLCLIYFYIRKLESKIEVYNKDNLIKYQRSRLEDRVYDATDKLVFDDQHFADMNHLILDASAYKDLTSKRNVPNRSYFEELGIKNEDFYIQEKLATCLMPFSKKYRSIYDVIMHSCEFSGFKCRRTDDELIATNSNLRRFIVSLILQAEVVIAEIDGRNPNVMYEVGLAHAMGKLVIIVVKRDNSDEIPENLKGNRLVVYRNEDDLFEQLNKTLSAIQYER